LGSVVLKDLPPYVIANGYPAVPHGINKEGLKRRGFNPDEIMKIRRAYKVLYRSGLSLEDAKQELLKLGEESEAVKVFADFIINAKRSIARAK
jgi:UDP-N-acetylglucosamine acyltransferase